jgi:hypothetical protein
MKSRGFLNDMFGFGKPIRLTKKQKEEDAAWVAKYEAEQKKKKQPPANSQNPT